MAVVIDPVALAQALVRCPSVTPTDEGAMDVLQAALESIGFQVWRMTFGEAPDGPVENLFARRGSGGRHFAFAGHTDVVPVGHGWTQEPFAGKIAGRSEEHTSELQSLMRISYAVFCLKQNTLTTHTAFYT